MTRATKKLSLSLLALALLCLALSLGARADDGFTVRYSSAGDGEYTISVEGLDGTYNVYAVQLELGFSGEYPDARLIPTDPAVYSPDAAATVNNGQTRLNIYLSSLSPINDGAALTLGTLYSNASAGLAMPAAARLTMLGADLAPVPGADGTSVSVRSASGVPASPDGTGSSVSAAPLPFSDVGEGDWYFGAVKYVYSNGMMNGTDGASFSPALTASRAMLVTVLYRLEDGPSPASPDFTDVRSGAWYADAVGWASAKRVAGGYGDGRFGPGEAVTREQLAAILYRYAALKGLDVSASDALSGFTDSGSVSPYALDAMRWAVGSGLISGRGGGVLDPGGSATRAEAAAVLMRFCQMA